ncbi:MAG: hypothetical protein JSR61_00595 [Proteobacteria bacterium]|nr:hypothetical protein [Pseudomonadota bacterium]
MTPTPKLTACPQMHNAIASLTRPDSDLNCRWLYIAIHLVSFIVLCLIVFIRQNPVVMFRYDGTFLLISAKNQALWMGHGAAFTMNFLEGNGGLWWAQINTLFDPALVFAQWVESDTYAPAVAYTIYATEFFLATLLLGGVLKLRLAVSLTAAWLGSLVSFPFFVPTLGTDLLWGNPHALPVISLVAVMAYALSRINAGRLGPAILVALALIGIGGYIGFEFAGASVQVIPVTAAFAIASVWHSDTVAERVIKTAVLAVTAAILSILFGRFLIGLYLDTKGTVFPLEMWPRLLDWQNISSLLIGGGRPMSRILWILALCGAIPCAIFGKRPLRSFAVAYLAIEAGIAAAVLLIRVLVGPWWGPNPAYFDVYAYTLTSLLAAGAIFVLFDISRNAVGSRWRWSPPLPKRLSASITPLRCAIALAVLPWLTLAFAQPPYSNQNNLNQNPWRWPPKATALTDFLQGQVGLVPGATFRGRVASLAGTTFDASLQFAPFASQHNYDQIPLVYVGNDHRIYGLLYFGIPILFESNHFSSPFYHLVMTRLLNDGPVTSTHAQTALTKFDPRVFAAFGVRYVVTDVVPAAPTRLAMTFKIVDGRPQYVYEIDNPNTGQYSPTETVVAADATEAMRIMAAPSFDFGKKVVLTEALPAASAWVAADKGEIKVLRDRLEISASSRGRSILVLPVEYSHCLVFDLKSGEPGTIDIRRANLEQTAVAFTGTLSGSIALRYGPFENAGCRLADLKDAETLKLGAVPRALSAAAR